MNKCFWIKDKDKGVFGIRCNQCYAEFELVLPVDELIGNVKKHMQQEILKMIRDCEFDKDNIAVKEFKEVIINRIEGRNEHDNM